MDPLRLSGFSSNVDALNAAWETGAPLRLDRDLILEKDVEVTIGRGRRLELFGGRIVSAPGSLILNARKIATLGLAETVSQGDRGVTVDDAAQVEPGDLVHIDTGISLGPDQWRMGDWGVVRSVAGGRLDFGWPLNWRYHPHRRLDYVADGRRRVFHYRLFWIPGREARVFVDGRPVGDDVEVTGRDRGSGQGFDVVFSEPPPRGARVSLTTASPLPVEIYRGGALHLHDLTLETDRAANRSDHHRVVHGVLPVGARFERIRCRERNRRRRRSGRPAWGGAVFIQPNTVGALLADIAIDGGGYALMIRGRDTHLRRIEARDCWAPVSSFHFNSHTHIAGLRCRDCLTAVDCHAGSFVHAKGVRGERVGGVSMRGNGAALIDAEISAAPGDLFGCQFGVAWQTPRDDTGLWDRRDNPVEMLNHRVSGLANDVLIRDVRFTGGDDDGFTVSVAPARRVEFRNVSTPGRVDFDKGPIDRLFTHRVAIDGLECGRIDFRAVRAVAATNLKAGALGISWNAGRDGGLRFENCHFDATDEPSPWIIDDRHNSGTTERLFIDCHFRGKPRLLAQGPRTRYRFIDCTGPTLAMPRP